MPICPKSLDKFSSLPSARKQAGIYGAFVDALAWITNKLQNEPKEWGDPVYPAKKKDAIVYRGLRIDWVVHYVLYEAEKTVLVLDVKHVD